MIKVCGLIKKYASTPVLNGLDLHVQKGEFVTLVGPNGAGKSTLLHILATLSRPSGGEVSIGGWPLPQHANQVRGHIGLVSHQLLLYRDLSAAENLAFFAHLYQLEDATEKVMEGLKKVGLFARQRDPVGSFSRGMLQRLTIARATLHEPEVLLLDEPYTGLDQDATELLDSLLAQEVANGRTILMITHDLIHGLEQCHRLAILHQGKIVADIESAQIDRADLLDLYAGYTSRQGIRD